MSDTIDWEDLYVRDEGEEEEFAEETAGDDSYADDGYEDEQVFTMEDEESSEF